MDEWLEARGRGEAARLVRVAVVSYPSIRLAAEGRLTQRAIAERISAATGGVVPVCAMRNVPEELEEARAGAA